MSRLILVRSAAVVALVLVLLAVRPGVVVNTLRSPVALLVVAGGVLLAVGVRAGLQRAGARPGIAQGASTAVVLALLLVLLAPSFRQRTLVEAVPAVPAVPAAPVAPAAPLTPATVEAPPPAPTEPSPVPVVTRQGELEGIGHAARGPVRVRTAGGAGDIVFDDIDVEGTVEPSVHLVRAGGRTPADGIRLGALKAERGTFSYPLPAGTDLTQGWSVLIWCDAFDTPIAVADLG